MNKKLSPVAPAPSQADAPASVRVVAPGTAIKHHGIFHAAGEEFEAAAGELDHLIEEGIVHLVHLFSPSPDSADDKSPDTGAGDDPSSSSTTKKAPVRA